ncbi:MAG: hypothetical protein ACRYF0_19745 [Janthinobacterium lividum]
METLQIGTSTRQVPAIWNELRRRQLLDVLAELYSKPDPARRLRLLAILTGFRLPLLTSLAPDVLAQLLPLTDFLSSETHLLTEQLLPTLGIPGRHLTVRPTTWQGPRGYADGGPTTGSGAQLPVAAVSSRTDGEMLYAVMTQLLDQAKATNAALVDVAQWPKYR